MDAIAGPTFQYSPGTLPMSAELLAKFKFPAGADSPWSALLGNFPAARGPLGASPASLVDSIMKSSDAVRASLGLPPLPPATPGALVNPKAITVPGILRAPKVHVFSASVPPGTPNREKLLEGFRAFSDLITPHLGPRLNIAVKSIWLAADSFSTVKTFRDTSSSTYDRISQTGGVAYDAAALLAAILGTPQMDHAATALNYGLVGMEHIHTGQLIFPPSELAQFSNQEGSDEASSILKLTEVLLPTGTE